MMRIGPEGRASVTSLKLSDARTDIQCRFASRDSRTIAKLLGLLRGCTNLNTLDLVNILAISSVRLRRYIQPYDDMVPKNVLNNLATFFAASKNLESLTIECAENDVRHFCRDGREVRYRQAMRTLQGVLRRTLGAQVEVVFSNTSGEWGPRRGLE
ncbi:hypothetical protein PMIN06_003999 [Paraphaeosphaeria minitans]